MAIAHQVTAERSVSIPTLPVKSDQELVAAADIFELKEEFGSSLQISADGSVLVVGARENNRVSIYQAAQGDWVLHSQLNLAEDDGADFGASVAISHNGGLIAIAADVGADGPGSVYLYQRQGRAWRLLYRLTEGEEDEEGDGFGTGLAMAADGGTLAVGAPDAFEGRGAAYVYQEVDGRWTTPEFVSEGETAGQDYARSVSLNADGSVLAVGHPGADTHEVASAGRVLVFTKADGSWDPEGAELLAEQAGSTEDPDGFANDLFGYTVALSGIGDRLAVGADGVKTRAAYVNAGAVYFFQRDEQGAWSSPFAPQTPTHYDTTPHFGRALALTHNGDLLLIGAPGEGTSGKVRKYGLAYWCVWGTPRTLFTDPTQQTLLVDSHFGHAVSVSADGECAAVSATGTLLKDAALHKPATSKVYLFGQSQPPASSGVGDGANDKVPGVRAVESNLPLLSIPSGSTAVPVFIGVFRDKNGELLGNEQCLEVASMADFRRRFGTSQTTRVTFVNNTWEVQSTAYLGSLSLQLYFDNGGGRCFILPLHDQIDADELAALPDKIRQCADITLYVVTEYLRDQPQHPAYNALGPLLQEVGDGFLIADSYDGVTRPATVEQRTAVYFPAVETLMQPVRPTKTSM